jgi:hypothetical protein
MSAQIDCPICMDCIETSKNCVTTECGHCFHASCLMTSVAHNGFGCPYCRAKMAEEPEEDEETVYSDEEEEEEEVFDEDALRGFRFFWNNLSGDAHDTEDIEEEEAAQEEVEDDVEEEYPVPSASFVAQKLQQQGVSYEQLVKMLLLQHEEYAEDEEAERLDNETFGKIRIIVSNYTPEQTVEPVPQPVQAPVVAPLVVPVIAEPKIYSRRIMMHV